MSQTAPEDLQTETLLRAFHSFAEVSSSLEKTYSELHGKVQSLSSQLEDTNSYLSSLLQSLPCGVLVVNSQGQVETVNQELNRLFGLRTFLSPAPLAALLADSPFGQKLRVLFDSPQAPVEIVLSDQPARYLNCCSSQMERGKTIWVIQETTELRTLEDRIRKSERMAAMGEMALEMAHEIRNPLAGLELFIDLLAQDEIEPQKTGEYLGQLRIGIQNLNTIVGNMLSFTQDPELTIATVDLAQLLRGVADFFRPLFSQRDIQVEEAFETDLPKLCADKNGLRQVFTNLFLNAVRALPEGGAIRISLRRVGGGVEVGMRDNGVGIPQESQEHVFEPRFTTNKKSSGLGLAISKRIVEAHSGTIQLESSPSRGTKFLLIFPLGEDRV